MSWFRVVVTIGLAAVVSSGCTGKTASPLAPGAPATGSTASQIGTLGQGAPENPPFNLEAVLRGTGFGLVKFRQEIDSQKNIIDLDVWVRDLTPDTSYSLQRAVDTTLDGACTGENWLTLGKGLTPEPIVTDETGTGRASLWRDLSAVAFGTAFDIHFRVVLAGTTDVALQSGCYRFVVRD